MAMAARNLGACVALAAVLASCPGDKKGASGGEAATLRIVVRATESAPPNVASLQCGAESEGTGFLAEKAKAEAACRAVLTTPLFPPAPPRAERICTQIYGGPQVARVTGTLRGRLVDRTFKRTNGCEIADWTAAAALLGEPAGPAPDAPQ